MLVVAVLGVTALRFLLISSPWYAFFSESFLSHFFYFVRRLSILIFLYILKPWWLPPLPWETSTICALPFLPHFSYLLLLLSVYVTLCCCLFLFCFLDVCVCFCFAMMKPQDAVAGSIKSSMACMQTPCALRLSIWMMCGRSTPYCMCSHPLFTSHDRSLFYMFI